jgi:predicted ABC-type ATPase
LIGKGEGAPRLWIVAGPNGCGKSTLYSESVISELDGSVWIVNPDLLTARLRQSEKMDLAAANLEAVKRIETWLRASVSVHQTIGVETVLSTPKYRPLVREARNRGFEIRFIYAYVESLECQLERIRVRVAKGGHDVPPDKVAARREKSFAQFPWFFWEADWALVYDNTGPQPKLVASKEQIGTAEVTPDLLPELHDGVMRAHDYE